MLSETGVPPKVKKLASFVAVIAGYPNAGCRMFGRGWQDIHQTSGRQESGVSSDHDITQSRRTAKMTKAMKQEGLAPRKLATAVAVAAASALLHGWHPLPPVASAFVFPPPPPRFPPRPAASPPAVGRLSPLLTSREELEGMTVLQLKEQLRIVGGMVSGRKSELIDRLLLAGARPSAPTGDCDGDDTSLGRKSVQTYGEYKDRLEALAYLSSVGDDEAVVRSQRVFDEMYENFTTEDDSSLEPTTEIYNLLLATYAESDPRLNPKGAEKADQILQWMEGSALPEEGRRGGVPSISPPNLDSYVAVMRGYANRGQPMKTESVFTRMEDRYLTTGEGTIKPNTSVYNQRLRAWLKSGSNMAPSCAEDVLAEMIDACEDNVAPDTESFARTMDCHAVSNSKDAPNKIDDLLVQMKALGLEHTTVVYNAKLKSFGNIGPSGAKEAEELLQWMIKQYDEGNGLLKPNPASFINVINTLNKSRQMGAPQKADSLLITMERLSQSSGDAELQPSVRAYNACIRCWARSFETDKVESARCLLDKMLVAGKSGNAPETAPMPNLLSYNTVLNAAAFYNKGRSREEKFAAFQVAASTLNDLRMSEHCEPDHVSYGTFLRACLVLMPSSARRDGVVESIFKTCRQEGKVSQYVLDSLLEVASDSLQTALFEGVDEIPFEWNRNIES